MPRAPSPQIACAALALAALSLAAGCGSSKSPSSRAGAPAATSTSSTTGGLQAATTPKYGAPPTSAHVQSGTVQIAYRNITVHPDTLKVKVGSTIRWTNYDSVEHNV